MKLFLSILFLLLIILLACGFLSFLFLILLPSLRMQRINVKETLFSKEEKAVLAGIVDFEKLDCSLLINVQNSADGCAARVEKQSSIPASVRDVKAKKNFSLFEKCYKIFCRNK